MLLMKIIIPVLWLAYAVAGKAPKASEMTKTKSPKQETTKARKQEKSKRPKQKKGTASKGLISSPSVQPSVSPTTCNPTPVTVLFMEATATTASCPSPEEVDRIEEAFRNAITSEMEMFAGIAAKEQNVETLSEVVPCLDAVLGGNRKLGDGFRTTFQMKWTINKGLPKGQVRFLRKRLRKINQAFFREYLGLPKVEFRRRPVFVKASIESPESTSASPTGVPSKQLSGAPSAGSTQPSSPSSTSPTGVPSEQLTSSPQPSSPSSSTSPTGVPSEQSSASSQPSVAPPPPYGDYDTLREDIVEYCADPSGKQ